MSELEASNYIEKTKIHSLVEDPNISDVSYNGEALYYLHSFKGRRKSDIAFSPKEAFEFLLQISNLTEHPFSYSNPILDVSFGRYRLNGVHPSLGRKGGERCPTFSLRLASEKSKIEGDIRFFPPHTEEILTDWMEKGESIVIGGISSSGKTELQKYLLKKLPNQRKCIVIDNIDELGLLKNVNADISTWLVTSKASYSDLIRNALRNDPDYIILAEARGGEMLDALTSALSGHPIILTIHADKIEDLPERMVRLAMQGKERLLEEELRKIINSCLTHYVLLGRSFDENGGIYRSIKALGETNEQGEMQILYKENL